MNVTPANIAVAVFFVLWCAAAFWVMTPRNGERRDHNSFAVLVFGALIAVCARPQDLVWLLTGFFLAGFSVAFFSSLKEGQRHRERALTSGLCSLPRRQRPESSPPRG